MEDDLPPFRFQRQDQRDRPTPLVGQQLERHNNFIQMLRLLRTAEDLLQLAVSLNRNDDQWNFHNVLSTFSEITERALALRETVFY